MTNYEIYSFESYKAHVHDDERPIDRADLSLLDEAGITDYSHGQARGSSQNAFNTV